jgi:hypothetical protein
VRKRPSAGTTFDAYSRAIRNLLEERVLGFFFLGDLIP